MSVGCTYCNAPMRSPDAHYEHERECSKNPSVEVVKLRAQLAAANGLVDRCAAFIENHEWGGTLENSYSEAISPACIECGGIPNKMTFACDGTAAHVGHLEGCDLVALTTAIAAARKLAGGGT